MNGIFLLDKPLYLTSNQALQQVKKIFAAKKAGHTGSLDPLATGMLPICFGEATKFSQFLLEGDKHYDVVVKLGSKTTTGDLEGEVIATAAVPALTPLQIENVLQQFMGTIQQIPPMYSAIKHQGKPLYELARKGIEIERPARTVTIHQLVLKTYADEALQLAVHCSKGTYIRTLAEDIGEKLGSVAHVVALRRTAVVPFEHHKMMTLDELVGKNSTELFSYLLPVEMSVDSLPRLDLTASAVFYLKNGQSISLPTTSLQGLVRIFSNHQFVGVGEILAEGRVVPRRLVQH